MSLKPYAQIESDSRGRRHKETEHKFRGIYQRDRDRVVHSRAFRRLEYKTQVFVNHEGDHYRTRLTHTLEVATLSRTVARALGLNEDLAEAIALAHDLGHPPFGHQGEYILNDLMKDHGGFEHNRQSLRIVDQLEKKYPAFNGLNLTWEVREGIAKHSSTYDLPDWDTDEFPRNPSLEAQVVDIADEIAYTTHDLDDGLASELLVDEDLLEMPLWQSFHTKILAENKNKDSELIRAYTVRCLINHLVNDLIVTITANLNDRKIAHVDQVRECADKLVSFSPEVGHHHKALKKFLYDNLYTHYHVARLNRTAKKIIHELFLIYTANPREMGRASTERARTDDDLHRVVCDYIAGMTDRFAFQEYKRFLGDFEPLF